MLRPLLAQQCGRRARVGAELHLALSRWVRALLLRFPLPLEHRILLTVLRATGAVGSGDCLSL